ncbi:MAG: hypothetical protein AAFR87_04425 [Bacteroidota bacterium]
MMIRKALQSDIFRIMEIWLDFMHYLRGINSDYYALSASQAAFSDFLEESLALEERRIFVAEQKGVLLGFL